MKTVFTIVAKSALLFGSVLLLGNPEARAAEPEAPPQKLVHVSFGFTKDFYADYNRWFAEQWKRKSGKSVVIEQSHGASGSQTEAVIAGKLVPDVLTLASPTDIDNIVQKTDLVDKNWRKAFQNASSPYYSAVVFLVRKGNPKAIRDFQDLALPDRNIITSNPKACGGGRWNYLAALGLGPEKNSAAKNGAENKEEAQSRDYLAGFVKNVPVFYANQGEAGQAFLKQGSGDVLLTYESFALSVTGVAASPVELVVPPRTVEITLPVAIARKNTEKNKTTALAQAYLAGLYDPEVQALFAKHHFRPRSKAVAAKTAALFPVLKLVASSEVFSADAERQHLTEGGSFDALRTPAVK